MSKPTVGVLAVQGAFIEHERRLSEAGASPVELRCAADISADLDGLVLPGGESTTQLKLLHELGMFEPMLDMIQAGTPVMGTCAGMILLAKDVEGGTANGFRTLPIRVLRNAYGRQLGSFSARGIFQPTGQEMELRFIRAPRIENVEDSVETLVSLDGQPVAVRFGDQIACAFHPELTDDLTLYEEFLKI